MVGPPKVTLRGQWLGKILRELRGDNGMTLKDAADHVRRSTATISRYEAGLWPPPRRDVEDLMNLYGVEEPSQRTLMRRLADEVTVTGWWDRYHKDVYNSLFDRVWLESRAERLRFFNPLVVPGLLQTKKYAEVLIRANDPDASMQQVERWVGVRMNRQEILRKPNSPQVEVILDEAAIRRPVGSAAVMTEQLRRLRAEVSRANVSVRVLPFSVGEYPGPLSSFTLIKMEDPFPEVAVVDSAVGCVILEVDEVREFASVYDRLCDLCLDADESRAFISDIERNL